MHRAGWRTVSCVNNITKRLTQMVLELGTKGSSMFAQNTTMYVPLRAGSNGTPQ